MATSLRSDAARVKYGGGWGLAPSASFIVRTDPDHPKSPQQGIAPQKGMTNADQLKAFCRQLEEQAEGRSLKADSWFEAFRLLDDSLPKSVRTVVLLDEISWMGKYDPNFAGELKFAWDRRFKRRSRLIFVLCGSVSSWIADNILNNTGFVGRISLDLVVGELPLKDCTRFWGKRVERLAPGEILDVLSVTGGVPKYLEEIRPNLSADENIRRLCFTPSGTLFPNPTTLTPPLGSDPKMLLTAA